MEFEITLGEKSETKDFVKHNLHMYNMENCEYIKNNSNDLCNDKIDGSFTIYHKGKIIGGALGYIKMGWYHLTDFYVDKEYRKNRIGTKVIKKIELLARKNNALGVKIDSWSFQAPKFYQKLGYVVWGEFKDCPPGTTHYYLYKKF